MRPSRAWLCACLLACATGCRALVLLPDTAAERPDAAAADSTAARSAPRTIPVEVVFVRYADADADLGTELWNEVDEQAVDDGLRRRLAANGLRAGIVTGDLPPHLAERTLPDRAAPTTSADAVAADAPLTHRLLRLLPGRRSEILVSSGIDELVLLEERDGQVRGGTFRDASGVLELKVRPAADGRVRVELVPEIRHGPLERSWVGEEGMFRMEAGQRRHRRDDLALGVDLREGDLLVVAGGGTAATLGDALLRDPGGDRSTRRLVVVRPLGPAVDPIFADASARAGDEQDVLEIR
ncbi:MAG: hypothetical protein ACKOC4_03480 [Planctomycetia bacterium]